MQSTVMFTLPEGRQGRAESIAMTWQEDEVQQDGSTKQRRRQDAVYATFTGKTVGKYNNLVMQTRWKITPRGHWPKELGKLEEIIFAL
jgi:hypothetical protein